LIDLVIDYGQDAEHWTSFGEQAFSFAVSEICYRLTPDIKALNRTYRERNSAVWCGTVRVHILLFTVKAYIPVYIPCFIMTNEVIIIRCQKHQRLVYGIYPHRPIYPQYTPETNQN